MARGWRGRERGQRKGDSVMFREKKKWGTYGLSPPPPLMGTGPFWAILRVPAGLGWGCCPGRMGFAEMKHKKDYNQNPHNIFSSLNLKEF